MPVRLTPRGTRGSRFFDPPPLLKGRPLLLLTTTGAKTGKRRQTPLGWFEDDPPRADAWLVVASAAGAASPPGWYINLARRSDDASIDVGGEHVAVTPESLEGEERERAWARIVALAPGYGQYAVNTDREIPGRAPHQATRKPPARRQPSRRFASDLVR